MISVWCPACMYYIYTQELGYRLVVVHDVERMLVTVPHYLYLRCVTACKYGRRYHWPEVGRVLHQMLVSAGDVELARKIEPMQRGLKPEKNALGQLVRDYTGVLNEIFALRAEAFVQLVLRRGLGFTDFWYRIEFSKLRAQVCSPLVGSQPACHLCILDR